MFCIGGMAQAEPSVHLVHQYRLTGGLGFSHLYSKLKKKLVGTEYGGKLYHDGYRKLLEEWAAIEGIDPEKANHFTSRLFTVPAYGQLADDADKFVILEDGDWATDETMTVDGDEYTRDAKSGLYVVAETSDQVAEPEATSDGGNPQVAKLEEQVRKAGELATVQAGKIASQGTTIGRLEDALQNANAKAKELTLGNLIQNPLVTGPVLLLVLAAFAGGFFLSNRKLRGELAGMKAERNHANLMSLMEDEKETSPLPEELRDLLVLLDGFQETLSGRGVTSDGHGLYLPRAYLLDEKGRRYVYVSWNDVPIVFDGQQGELRKRIVNNEGFQQALGIRVHEGQVAEAA